MPNDRFISRGMLSGLMYQLQLFCNYIVDEATEQIGEKIFTSPLTPKARHYPE